MNSFFSSESCKLQVTNKFGALIMRLGEEGWDRLGEDEEESYIVLNISLKQAIIQTFV